VACAVGRRPTSTSITYDVLNHQRKSEIASLGLGIRTCTLCFFCNPSCTTDSYENGGSVFLEEMPDDVPMAPAGGGNGNPRAQWENAMLAKMGSVEQKIVAVSNNQTGHHAMMDRRLRILEANTSRIAIQPVVRTVYGGGNGGSEARPPAATLGKPRDLYQLWNEYEFGLGGRKPARQFTAVERGAVKCSYSRRKIVWDAIDRMVRSGATAQVAIDRIYGVYGRLNVSAI